MSVQAQAHAKAATRTPQEAWSTILAEIAKSVSKQQYATWFPSVAARSASAGRIELEVPNAWIKSWLVQHYQTVIREAASRVLGASPEIVFHIQPQAEPERPAAAAPPPAPPAETDAAIPLNEAYTFENFVMGNSNRLAYGAAELVATVPAHTYNPLFIYGDVGLGKTHLLQAICHDLRKKHPHLRIRYASCETFTNDFIAALATKQPRMIDRFRDRYRKADVLVVDDIHFLAGKSSTQEEFYHTFNELYGAKKQIILSSDSPPEVIPTIEQRLLSRIKWGMVAAIEKPDYETRTLILRKKAQVRGTPFPDDVVSFLASHLDTNVRELEGAVVKLSGHAVLTHREISVDLAREVFKGYLRESGTPVTLQDVQAVVTEHYQVRLSDLQSRGRSRAIALPRQVCMYLARRLTAHSLEEIGRYFGGRDHSTVIYACDQVARHVSEDPQVRRLVEGFSTRLKRKTV